MVITLISVIVANIITFSIYWDGGIMSSLLLAKFSILAMIVAGIGIIESKKEGNKYKILYLLIALLLTFTSFNGV